MSETPSSSSPIKALKPTLWTNPITLVGLLFVAVGILLLVTFWLFMLISPAARQNQYVGIVGYMLLPGVLINGMMMCPAGMWLRRRKLRKHADFQQVSIRHALIFLAVTFFLILPILGVAGYKGYQFTEAAEFCGTICHNMNPQWTRYGQSPHARVTCAGCHIGPGADFFVKAKLSGMRQVYFTLTDSFPRPIPPAITSLRPARDTCEECHWPSQFFGSLLRTTVHYAPDEQNTRHAYELLVKVGGLNNVLGKAEGIHMHMLDRVEYVATDAILDKIPWVKYRTADGKETVYRSDGKAADAAAPEGNHRLLDCIDCHNTAGHQFLSPERAVDHELSIGRLDATLPFIKRQAVIALAGNYTTTPQAIDAIQNSLRTFYQTSYPDYWNNHRQQVDQAVEDVCTIYRAQFFPEMHVDWRTYPSHLGHMESPGCFRCHDGLHVSDDGKRISSDCQTCHTFQYHQPDDPKVIVEKKFDHPMKINAAWQGLGPHEEMLCTDCHDGGLSAVGWNPSAVIYQCGNCHPTGRWEEIQKTLTIRRAASSRPSSQ